MTRISAKRDVYYPDSDGTPVGETPRHVKVMLQTFGTLEQWFEKNLDCFVGCNMFLYYQERSPRKHVSPDVFVVQGIPKNRKPERRNYKTWEEGKGPDWVLEVTSDTTRSEDLETKFKLYQDRLGVREYFLFDPYGEYLRPTLQGYRREEDRFTPLVPTEGRLISAALGLHLEADQGELRLFDPKQGQWLKTFTEVVRENQEKAEGELKLKKEIARLRKN